MDRQEAIIFYLKLLSLLSLIQHPTNQMCRIIGYVGGIVLFMVLGIEKIKGYEFFFATAILNLIAIFLVFLFRFIAKYVNGFWRIWCKRLQRQIGLAMACLSHVTELPEYEITTTTIDGYGNKSVSTSTTSNTFIWGCIECAVCVLLTGISPLIVAFLLFCYIEAIYYECKFKKQQKAKNQQKEEVIARQSARMSLNVSLNNSPSYPKNTQTTANYNTNYIPTFVTPDYPVGMMKKTYTHTVYMPNQMQNYPVQTTPQYPEISQQQQHQMLNENINQNQYYQNGQIMRGDSNLSAEQNNIQLTNIHNQNL